MKTKGKEGRKEERRGREGKKKKRNEKENYSAFTFNKGLASDKNIIYAIANYPHIEGERRPGPGSSVG